jgi:hypothetical protein
LGSYLRVKLTEEQQKNWRKGASPVSAHPKYAVSWKLSEAELEADFRQACELTLSKQLRSCAHSARGFVFAYGGISGLTNVMKPRIFIGRVSDNTQDLDTAANGASAVIAKLCVF